MDDSSLPDAFRTRMSWHPNTTILVFLDALAQFHQSGQKTTLEELGFHTSTQIANGIVEVRKHFAGMKRGASKVLPITDTSRTDQSTTRGD